MKILLPVDGSKHSMDAVDCLIARADWCREPPEVELVYVHLPVPKLPGMSAVVGKAQIEQYYEEEGQAHLAPARNRLDAAKFRYTARVLVGTVAETVVEHAKTARCDLILIGTRGMTAAANIVLGSVASKVLHLSPLPVLLVK